ncbi:golgin subfamily A member 5-like [Xyrichtys novacula]|uniref:Golgin subfamily A member 5-like n=1 Tax=Xyrichtys novacula TaxID=13765 RepID=A0AAV1G2Y8_XYRNO|nr:golgin subfamily A member 5-like [Xyrichtys novacula]
MQCMKVTQHPKVALEQQVKDLQEEVSRRAEETSIITVKAQELHNCLQSLNAQLETERCWNLALQNDRQDLCLRLKFADQLYSKQVEQLEQLEQLEAEKLALEQKVKELQEDGISRRAEDETSDTGVNQELQELVTSFKTQLQAEKNRAENLKREGEDLRSQLQIVNDNFTQLEAEKLAQEQTVRELQEEIMSRAKTETIYLAKIKEGNDMVASQIIMLEEKDQMADDLMTQLEEVRHQLLDKSSKEMKLIEDLTTENESLKQTVRELQEEIMSRTETETICLTKIQEGNDMVASQIIMLEEKDQMADDLMTQLEEVRHQLLDKSSKEMKLIEDLTTENESLKQKVSDLQREAQSRDEFYEDQLETLNSLLKIARFRKRRARKNRSKENFRRKLRKVKRNMLKTIKETPEMEEISEATPEMEEISGATPKMEEISGATPEMEEISGATPKMEEISGATPEMEEISGATPKMEEISGATPEMEEISGATPEMEEISGATPEMEEISGATPEMEEISGATPKMEEISGATPETFEETPQISWWRRVKKGLTPKHRRQYKQRRSDQQMKTPTSP